MRLLTSFNEPGTLRNL